VALFFGLAALNDYGQFFGSWSELLGTGPAATVVAVNHFGAPDRTLFPGPGTSTHTGRHQLTEHAIVVTPGGRVLTRGPSWYGIRTTGWSPRSAWATRGAVLTMPLTGPTTGLTEQADVYLPPAYIAGDRTLPVVEVFTGYPGGRIELVDRLDYPSMLLAAMNRHAAKPMVLVMLRPAVTYPRDTECTDVPNGPQVFSYFAHDVPSVVTQAFGLGSTSFGAIGDSTGGLCAAKLATMDPHQFDAAATLSGYFHAISDFTTGNLYGSTAVRNRNDIMWRLRHLPAPRVALLICTSLTERGEDGYRSAQALLRLVRPPTTADEIVLSSGGHNFSTWKAEIPRALPWLSRHLAS
jgi:S-formylglutathione hydrolase FrmB